MLDEILWERICAVRFDQPGAELCFSDRLARDNRWTKKYARRVVEEERSFAYPAVKAGHEVTPSDEVDQAWHLHLTYTRHYWGEFCDALGAPFHHGPTSGGGKENDRYNDNYARRLEAYALAFGEPPPADIWPPAEIRFAAARYMARLNTAENFVLPRNVVFRAAAGLSGAAMLAAAIGAAAAATGASDVSIVEKLKSLPPIIWIGVAVIFVVVALLVRFAGAGSKGKAARTGCGGAGGGSGKGGDGDGGCSSGCGGGCGG